MKSRLFIVILFILAAAVLRPTGFVHAAENQIKLGVLPVIRALPLYVAQEKGLFEAEGINVDVIPFKTALEKDMGLSSGNLDGNFGDLFTPIVLRSNGLVIILAAAMK